MGPYFGQQSSCTSSIDTRHTSPQSYEHGLKLKCAKTASMHIGAYLAKTAALGCLGPDGRIYRSPLQKAEVDGLRQPDSSHNRQKNQTLQTEAVTQSQKSNSACLHTGTLQTGCLLKRGLPESTTTEPSIGACTAYPHPLQMKVSYAVPSMQYT